jgi:hypothetical protein
MRTLVHQGLESGVVVAMDWGAYKYLVHRNIPATLMTTSLPLDVCCLRRFKMVPWRATNDIKVGAFRRAAVHWDHVSNPSSRAGQVNRTFMTLCTLCPACQTRAIIQALKMGLRVLMLDMDASPNGPALRPDGLLKDNDLMYTSDAA